MSAPLNFNFDPPEEPNKWERLRKPLRNFGIGLIVILSAVLGYLIWYAFS